MKQLLFLVFLGSVSLSLTGCGENKKPETASMKCEAGKCGAAMEKDAAAVKPTADTKCGEGKCGDK